ncbi:MAG: sensor domain-containing protein [Dehalococcoidales bacterium]|nr:sensor domain-containing protein [Dehalococcoidales bacterium]
MINNIEQYLTELKRELAGSDRATVQDALADAEEYLRTALDNTMKDSPVPEAEALAAIIEKYGQPREIASAYKDIESSTPLAFARPACDKAKVPAIAPVAAPPVPDTRPFYARFFGVFAEPRAWGALIYLLFTLGTGVAYFTWAVTGLSVSAGLIVLIVGLPILALFLFSARGIALLEGRIIEALVGIRMPRRPLFSRKDIGWWQKFKNVFTERHTWSAVLYMILQMPLGIIYFTVFVSLISFAGYLIMKPVTELVWDMPTFIIGDYGYYTPVWLMPFAVIAGILLLFVIMHLAKYTARLHGMMAKYMLVRE